MEVAIQYLRKQITEIQESDMSELTKQHMINSFTYAIHVLEYDRYRLVPSQIAADQLNQLEYWKELWDTGYNKFVPELLGLTKAIILDKAFTETPIKQEEVVTTQTAENTGTMLLPIPGHLLNEIVESQGEEGSIEMVIQTEPIEEVKIEGRFVEEVKAEGKKKGFFSWFK